MENVVIQPVLKTGTSLTKTVETTTKIENIILDNFPEVKQVVSRIGAAEVPTDPMSMEESDIIIILKPKSQWKSAKSKDELADKFKEALAVIPGMELEFTQPIEMRFNELVTGVRADIAIKIFGEDLNILNQKANEIKSLIENVEGAADIIVEKVEGLPQMNVAFDRSKIARYGINIADLNEMVTMGFAGKKVGSVFEGEKQFDLVVRLDPTNRKDISDLQNLYIDIPSGGKIPLNELAVVSYRKGAAKISRDNTRRRIVVGINVRNKDLQSVVDEIKSIIDSNVNLPTGYTITYGGQFENLQSARAKLVIAVPIALLLIFTMLYFAFRSVKEALLIFTAIPLSAVGGVLLLWMRGMPFSISAAVGFIALFGIAVLNGIVLIEHYKELMKEPFKSMEELIKKGTKNRLRAVLLTAAAAALGFLPMAISTSAGAEVQRPLATVVIGGLTTATLLTLLVLPVLYAALHDLKFKKMKFSKNTITILVLIIGCLGHAQQRPVTLEELKVLALKHNKQLKASKLSVEQAKALRGEAFDFNKTEVYYHYDENNLALNDLPVNVFGVQQSFDFPTVYGAKSKLKNATYELQQNTFEIEKKQLLKALCMAYYQYQTLRQKQELYKTLDSAYTYFAKAAGRRFELGETNYLEKITALAKQKQITNSYIEAKQELAVIYGQLRVLVQSPDSLVLLEETPKKLEINNRIGITELERTFLTNRQKVSDAQKRLENHRFLPDLNLEYFQGSNELLDASLYGVQLGIEIPILFFGQDSRAKSAKLNAEKTSFQNMHWKLQTEQNFENLMGQLEQLGQELEYYENEGKQLADEILKVATGGYRNGEIDFFQYIQSLENAYELQMNQLDVLNRYNQTVLAINYLTLTN